MAQPAGQIGAARHVVGGERVATFEARQSALTIGIRGIVPLDANQPAREQGVGIYIDGVYLGRQHGLNAALFDVERVEVLKGPQGTLFGRNTTGGAIVIHPNLPTRDYAGRFSASIGNFGTFESDLMLNAPLNDQWQFRIAAGTQSSDGWLEDVELHRKVNRIDRNSVRGSVAYRPNDQITNTLVVDVFDEDDGGQGAVIFNVNPASPFNSPAFRTSHNYAESFEQMLADQRALGI